ncbi:MAG: methyltransferase domain-containing protein, partial [Spirochaetota bacterium]
VYHEIIHSLKDRARERACSAFIKYGNPQSGFDPGKIKYSITKKGLSGENNRYDLIISRAVLEHVNDLENTFLDVSRALKKVGVSIHQVDLRSHNLDRYKDYDFLTWSPLVYKLMYGYKGFPNRWRVDRYKELADKFRLKCLKLEPTEKLDPVKIKIIHPKLAKPFRRLDQDDISWLGFWMIMEHDHLTADN